MGSEMCIRDRSCGRCGRRGYGSHSLRRTRVAHIYRKTANLRVAQVLLGHKTIENTARYLGIEEEQAMEIAEQFEI